MTAIIKALAFADGTPCPHADHWLKHFDHDAYDGRGHGVFTLDPNEAMKFPGAAEAMAFWNRQSKVKPRRPDGKPNKPMTGLTIEIETLL